MHHTIVWIYGPSAVGKTTIAKALAALLPGSVTIDGDEIRKTISANLGFSREDREENVRRIAEVAKIRARSNKYVIVSCITPTVKSMHDVVSAIPFHMGLLSVRLSAPVDVLEERDPKGLYAKLGSEEMLQFYEHTSANDYWSDLHFDTSVDSAEKIAVEIRGKL